MLYVEQTKVENMFQEQRPEIDINHYRMEHINTQHNVVHIWTYFIVMLSDDILSLYMQSYNF